MKDCLPTRLHSVSLDTEHLNTHTSSSGGGGEKRNKGLVSHRSHASHNGARATFQPQRWLQFSSKQGQASTRHHALHRQDGTRPGRPRTSSPNKGGERGSQRCQTFKSHHSDSRLALIPHLCSNADLATAVLRSTGARSQCSDHPRTLDPTLPEADSSNLTCSGLRSTRRDMSPGRFFGRVVRELSGD